MLVKAGGLCPPLSNARSGYALRCETLKVDYR